MVSPCCQLSTMLLSSAGLRENRPTAGAGRGRGIQSSCPGPDGRTEPNAAKGLAPAASQTPGGRGGGGVAPPRWDSAPLPPGLAAVLSHEPFMTQNRGTDAPKALLSAARTAARIRRSVHLQIPATDRKPDPYRTPSEPCWPEPARYAPGRNRTYDLALRRRALYPLSYRR
jgi:hypothetical protein